MSVLPHSPSRSHWAVQGDLAAFNAALGEHQRAAYTLALALLHDPAAADRATLQAFLTAYHSAPRSRESSLRAWLLGLVIRACRRERVRRPQIAPSSGSPIEGALAALPEQQRLAVLLVDRLGCSREEASVAAGIRTQALDALLAQARARLAAALSAA